MTAAASISRGRVLSVTPDKVLYILPLPSYPLWMRCCLGFVLIPVLWQTFCYGDYSRCFATWWAKHMLTAESYVHFDDGVWVCDSSLLCSTSGYIMQQLLPTYHEF